MKLIRNFLVIGVLFATGAFANNLLTNGSFESGSFSNNSNPYGNGYGQLLAVGSTNMSNWNIITNPLSWLYTGDFSLTPEDGSYFLDLTGYYDATPFGGVSQSVSLAAGNYNLSFWIGYSGIGTDLGPVSVTAAAGSTSNTFSSGSGGSGVVWVQRTLNFNVATAGNVLISLVGNSTTGGKYIGLDNVDLELVPSGVPEPAMILPLALAGAFFVISRRKRARQ